MSKSPGHQQRPDHKIQEEHLLQRVKAAIDGQVLANSDDVIRLVFQPRTLTEMDCRPCSNMP